MTGRNPLGIIILAFEKSPKTGCSSAWLERLVWDQEAAGSNPVTPIALAIQTRLCYNLMVPQRYAGVVQ